MNKKRLIVMVLMTGLAIFGWQSYRFRSDSNGRDERLFTSQQSSNKDSFGMAIFKDDKGFARALTPQKFVFPRDHGPHNNYRSEWWYFTGNLKNFEGRQFGYELTFFRFALNAAAQTTKSAWRTNQLYMAHLTLTDIEKQRFYAAERFSRAGNGLAGASADKYGVWLHDWSARAVDSTDFPLRLQAKTREFTVDLLLNSPKNYVLQGNQGLSQKSREPGNASYYYSYPRLESEGSVSIAGQPFSVSGFSWMDREWSTSALSQEQSGWDWFALQLSDNTELMFYQLRRKDGQPDSNSSGSFVLEDNTKISLQANDVSIKALDSWKSPHSKITYPSRWHLAVPGQHLELDVIPLLNDQELNLSYRYWEGAVSVSGNKNGKPISGQGYVELAGYK